MGLLACNTYQTFGVVKALLWTQAAGCGQAADEATTCSCRLKEGPQDAHRALNNVTYAQQALTDLVEQLLMFFLQFFNLRHRRQSQSGGAVCVFMQESTTQPPRPGTQGTLIKP